MIIKLCKQIAGEFAYGQAHATERKRCDTFRHILGRRNGFEARERGVLKLYSAYINQAYGNIISMPQKVELERLAWGGECGKDTQSTKPGNVDEIQISTMVEGTR